MHRIFFEQSHSPVDYASAVAAMEARIPAIAEGSAPEHLWFLEHPPLYTAGTSAKPEDLLKPRFPVYQTGRGGQFTYHGPGQRVAYLQLDLHKRPRSGDVRAFVQDLEQWIIATLAHFGIEGFMREGRIGVWVMKPDGTEAKIAALGIRVRRWVSYHGIAINLNPDLSHFGGIIPCGIREYGVTSCHDLGVNITMQELDAALKAGFADRFGPLEWV